MIRKRKLNQRYRTFDKDCCDADLGKWSTCGYGIVGSSFDLAPLSAGGMDINPTVVAHFEPKGMYMFGIDPNSPNTNLRFTIGNITVGGETQTAMFNPVPNGLGSEFLSDVFNRSDQPLIVDGWATFSTPGLGAPLNIQFFNLNNVTIRIYAALWGNPIDDCTAERLKEQEDGKALEKNFRDQIKELEKNTQRVRKGRKRKKSRRKVRS